MLSSVAFALRRGASVLARPLPIPRLPAVRGFAADAKKGGKGRDARRIVYKQPTQHALTGHGAKDRPLPAVARTLAFKEKVKATPPPPDKGLETDDELMQSILSLAPLAGPVAEA